MLGLWAALIGTGGVPELETAPGEIGFHLAAELLTALALVLAGAGVWAGRAWAGRAYPVALGMLLYTTINSAGYYAGLGKLAVVGMFVALVLATAAVAWLAVARPAVLGASESVGGPQDTGTTEGRPRDEGETEPEPRVGAT